METKAGWRERAEQECAGGWADSYLAALRGFEQDVQADLDIIRELIQDELLRIAREDGVLIMGGREVHLCPNPADEREVEIQAIMDEDGETIPQTATGLGAIAALGLALGAVFSIYLARPLPPVPRYEMPAAVAPVAVMGGERVTVTWYRGDQIADWQRSVRAEMFGVAGQDVIESDHATQAHNVEAVIARMAAQELCPPEFWQKPPCDDNRYRWYGRVPDWGGPLSQYAGRWAVVVIDAATMTERTSFLAGTENGDNYVRGIERRCHDGSLRPTG